MVEHLAAIVTLSVVAAASRLRSRPRCEILLTEMVVNVFLFEPRAREGPNWLVGWCEVCEATAVKIRKVYAERAKMRQISISKRQIEAAEKERRLGSIN